MAYPIFSTITFTGAESDVQVCVSRLFANSRPIGAPSRLQVSVDGSYDESPTGRTLWIDDSAWEYDEATTPTQATFKTECYKDYPEQFLTLASQQWPSLCFECESYQSQGDSSNTVIYSARNGAVDIEYYREHKFVMLTKFFQYPLHHWEILLRIEASEDVGLAIRQLLVDKGMFIGSVYPLTPTMAQRTIVGNSRIDPITILEFARKHFPDVEISDAGSTAWSLDENSHLYEIGAPPSKDGYLRDWIQVADERAIAHERIVEREDIKLNQTELDWLVEGLISCDLEVGRICRLEQIRQQLGTDTFAERYGSQIERHVVEYYDEEIDETGDERLKQWLDEPLTLEEAELADCHRFFPRGIELTYLLQRYHRAGTHNHRCMTLIDAIANPKWTSYWPDWDDETDHVASSSGPHLETAERPS